MAITGDTVRLTATFKDFSNNLVDPTTVVVQMYGSNKEKLGDPVTLDSGHRVSQGVYKYDYTIPSGHKKLYCEFTGTSENLPNTSRVEIPVTWS